MSAEIDPMGHLRRRKVRKNGRGKETQISFDKPTINWEKLQAIVTTCCVLFLVVAFLTSTFFIYSDSPTVKLLAGYTGDMARMSRRVENVSDAIFNSTQNVDMGEAFRNVLPQTNEEAKNLTIRGKRVVSDLALMIGDIKESNIIKTISEFANSISEILLRPNFGKILDTLEVGMPLVFDVLNKTETKAFINVLKGTMNKIQQLMTEERVDKVINALDDADVKNLLSHTSSFVQQATKTAEYTNQILNKVAFVVDHEEEYIRPIIHTVQHISSFISARVNEEEIDKVINVIKSLDWNGILRDLKTYYQIFDNWSKHNSDISLVEIGKNLTMEVSALIRQIESSKLVSSTADGINKLESSLSKSEIHDGYIEFVNSLKKFNAVLHDAESHDVMADFISIVQRFERMEKIVEAVFTPLEHGMDLYNEEQRKKNSGKTGDIQRTTDLINTIDHTNKRAKNKM